MNYLTCPVNKVARSVEKNKTAILDRTDAISYVQLEEFIQQAGLHLTSHGIKKRTKVGLFSLRATDFIIYYFALLRIHAVACLFSSRLPANALESEMIKLDCSFLISGSSQLRKLRNIKCIPFQNHHQQILLRKSQKRQVAQYRLDDISNIMFTSGSSGNPKAIVHSIGNHYYSALGSNRHIPLDQDDQWMLSLPAYHVAGLSIIWRAFIAGATLSVVDERMDLSRNIKERRPTHISVVATQLIHCMKDPACRKIFSKMKCVLMGGSAASPAVVKAAVKYRLPIYLSYGLTEMSSQAATSKKIVKMEDVNSVYVLPYRRLKIDTKQNVLVKGKTLFKGFYTNGRLVKVLDENGWYNTQDLGIFSRKNGLKIIGRRDNMFISGGENIHPEQIEQEILRHGLIEQAVVVPKLNSVYGHRPVAFLKVAKGKKFDRIKLINHLSLRIEKFKIPEEFYRWPEKENHKEMKVNRIKFKALVESNSSLLVKITQ